MENSKKVLKALISLLGVGLVVCLSVPSYGSNSLMKGPEQTRHHREKNEEIETSSVKLAFLGTVRLFQKRISPIDGDRCGFRPTCSAYAHRALRDQGIAIGLMMTGDRLMRCNIWKKPGADYLLLPNGRLFDPLSKNLLPE